MNATRFVLFGAGGHASAVADVLDRMGMGVVGVVDPRDRSGWKVRSFRDDEDGIRFTLEQSYAAAVTVGDNARRLELVRRLLAAGVRVPPIVASTATVARNAKLGNGATIMEHAHVGAGTVLRDAVIVNSGAIVEHGAGIEDGAHVAIGARLAGTSHCGTRALVGAGAVVLPGIRIGADAVVGAGAVVARPVREGTRVAGVPAQVIDDVDI